MSQFLKLLSIEMLYDRIAFDICYTYCVTGNVLIHPCVLLLSIVLFIDLIMTIEGKKNNITTLYIISMLSATCVVHVDEVLDLVSI